MNVTDKPTGMAPEGYHRARCYGILQLGTIFIYNHWKSMMRIEFELPDQTRTFNINEPEKPKMVSKECAASLYGKSFLKANLISWFGDEFVEIFSKNFDIGMILGGVCKIRIEHKLSSTGKWFEDITEIHALEEDELHNMPPQFYKTRSLLLSEENFDRDFFFTLPEFLRKKIMGSQEYRKMFDVQDQPAPEQQYQPVNNDVPGGVPKRAW